MNTKIGLVLIGATILTVGCAGKPTLQDNWGDTLRSYQKASVVNPDGQPPEVSALDGVKADQVIDAYHTEKGEMSNERIVTDVGGN